MIQKHRKILEDMLRRYPKLIMPLRKACSALTGGQYTVTVGEFKDFEMVCLNGLFPASIVARGTKFILDTQKLRQRIPDFDTWLEVAVSLAGTPETAKTDLSTVLEEIIIKAKYEFPYLADSIDLLEQNMSQLKSDITRDGKETAAKRILSAFNIVKFLKENTQLFSASKLGAELCGDSKILRRGTRLRYWVALLLAAEFGLSEDADGEDCLKRCGLLENMTASSVIVFGPFVYYSRDAGFDWIRQLYSRGESAMLSMDNLQHISRIDFESSADREIILCENESPFNQMISENKTSVYTAGFPNSAVKKFISLLAGNFEFLHWGDTDPEGLEIAALLNNIKPIKLYRCGIEDCERLKYALKELDPKKRKRAGQMLASPDFLFKKELEFTINNGWLEQEAWKPHAR